MELYTLHTDKKQLLWNDVIPASQFIDFYPHFKETLEETGELMFDEGKKYIKQMGHHNADVEEIMLNNHYTSEFIITYCLNVIKGRWVEGEQKLIKDRDPHQATTYAIEVIKGPWPEAEHIIMKNPTQSYYYATQVLKHRWPEAERYIKQDENVWHEYKQQVHNWTNEII